MKINLDRAKAGGALEIAEEIWAAHSAGMDWSDAASDVLADNIIKKYRGHIAAALREKGIPIEDGDTLDGDTLLRIVNERAGLTIEAWTPDAVKVALDSFMAGRLSSLLGVEVASVQDVPGLKQSLIDAAAAAVASGRANAFVSKAMIKKIRSVKAWKEGGVITEEEKRLTINRWYQKKFRRTHKGVWR